MTLQGYRSLLFSSNLLTIALSSQLQCVFSIHTFIPTFFVGRYHTPCLSTDGRFFLFLVILVDQVLPGSMGNTPPIWVDGVGDIFDVIFYWWILYIYVWDPDRDFAPLIKDYTSSSLLGSYLHVFLTDPLPLRSE